MPEPFAVKDCALIAIGTGEKVQNLRELRDRLLTIDAASIYHHFWGCLLNPSFDEPEYQNDFAAWAWYGLRDRRLAEKLAVIDPSQFPDIENLRRELIEMIEERLEETELVPWAKANQQFAFIRSQIVVFDTSLRIENPRMLQENLPRMSIGSIFYHFIDARRRPPYGQDDFSAWLAGFGDGYPRLAESMSSVDPYFVTLTELRRELEIRFNALCDKGYCDAELA
jgi:hypothetical protein